MLQDSVPHFGNHEVIDEHWHAALLSREARALNLKELGKGRQRAGIHEWIRLVDVIGNELMSPEMPAFGSVTRATSILWRGFISSPSQPSSRKQFPNWKSPRFSSGSAALSATSWWMSIRTSTPLRKG